MEGHGVVVVADRRHEIFAGSEYVAAVRAAAAGTAAADDEVRRATDELRQAGVLVALPAADDPAAAYWSRDGLPAEAVERSLAATSIDVVGLGDTDPAAVVAAVEEAGLTVAPDDAALELVLVDDYLAEELAERNEAALRTGRTWMLAAPSRTEVWVGPVFVPDRGACWECLAQRLRRHRHVDPYLREHGDTGQPVTRHAGTLPSTRRAAAGLIATQLLRWLALGPVSGAGRVLTVDTRTWESVSHAVTWRLQCPACGEPDASREAGARPPALTAVGAAPTVGGLRTVTPEATIDRYSHHLSPVSGIVALLAPASDLRPPMFAYLSGDPGPRVHGATDWGPGRTTPSGGKGTTDAQARVSALCEALERYCGEFTGEEPRRTASMEELGDAAIHPNDCMRVSETQYDRREETNPASTWQSFVPEPFDPAAPVDWSPLWSLTAGRERLLPTAYCYYNAPVAGREMCVADSNGNAAGNTIDEAILQGLLELVERDHTALWWYDQLPRPGLDLDAFGDPWLADLRRRLAGDGRELWALDLTFDLGIPAVVALATRSGEPDKVTMGLGAHLDLGRALVRAATELVQLEKVPSGGLGWGPQGALDSEEWSWLRPDPDAAPRSPADSPLTPSGDLRTDLDACVQRIEARGLEVLVLDQTRPDVAIPVVKVLAPGLRHFWTRFGPGRLYDVPVELGLLERARAEHELTAVPPVA